MNLKGTLLKYKFIFIIGLVFILIILFYEKKLILLNNINKSVIILMKNNTWDTELKDSVPYNKGDEIKYSIILMPNKSNITDINIDNIKNNIDITKIKLNGENININDLKNSNIDKKSVLEIEGIAKNDNNKETEIDLIKIKEEEIDEKIDEIITEEEIDEKIDEIKNIKINNLKYSSNINNLLEISGDNINQIKFVNIGGISFEPVKKNGKLYLGIDSNTFGEGDYFVIFKLKNNNFITYENKISFTFNQSKVNIANITPNIVKNDIDRNIVLQGNGFSKTISIQLSNNLILKNTNFNIINDNVMSILIPKDLKIGKYNLNIMDIEGIYKSNLTIEIIN